MSISLFTVNSTAGTPEASHTDNQLQQLELTAIILDDHAERLRTATVLEQRTSYIRKKTITKRLKCFIG